eukprot:4524653-Alexandrium_andersonii.AAC.1
MELPWLKAASGSLGATPPATSAGPPESAVAAPVGGATAGSSGSASGGAGWVFGWNSILKMAWRSQADRPKQQELCDRLVLSECDTDAP